MTTDKEEHPFAAYVRILARGRTISRALTQDESRDAMRMILAGEVEDIQLGAFLMLMRYKEETAEEVAGFVEACRAALDVPEGLAVDLDWSSYAGKRRQLPWFILAALLLAQNGVRIFMHGTEGHTPGRMYTRETLEYMGLPVASSIAEAGQHIAQSNFGYVPLEGLLPVLRRIIDLRPVLGLRSPVHTIARMINPLDAPAMIQGVFHPGYTDTHQGAAALIGQPHMSVFKGEGGEIERRPNKPLVVKSLHEGVTSEEEWPPLLPATRQPHDDDMDTSRLAAVWRDEIEDDYAVAAVTGTVALALATMGRATSPEDAQAQATAMWLSRDRGRLGAAA
jgi:anthranilate phosphoribosyltransferase